MDDMAGGNKNKLRKTVILVSRANTFTKPPENVESEDAWEEQISVRSIGKDSKVHPKPETQERRMSYWDRYKTEHDEEFANLPDPPRVDQEEIKAVFIEGEHAANPETNIANEQVLELASSSTTTADYLSGIPRMTRHHSRTPEKPENLEMRERTIEKCLDCHKESFRRFCSNGVKESSDSESEHIKELASCLKQREKNTRPLGIRRTPLKMPPKYWSIGRTLNSRYCERVDPNVINRDVPGRCSSPICDRRGHCANRELQNLRITEKSSAELDSLQTTSDTKFKVVFRSIMPETALNCPTKILNDFGACQTKPRTIKVGRGRHTTSAPMQTETVHEQYRKPPRINRISSFIPPTKARSVLKFLQGITTVTKSNPRRSVRFRDESHKIGRKRQPKPMIELGRRWSRAVDVKDIAASRRSYDTVTCSDTSSSECAKLMQPKRYDESESTAAFSSDDGFREKHCYTECTRQKRSSRIPSSAARALGAVRKWSKEFLTLGSLKYTPNRRPCRSLEPVMPSVLSCLIGNEYLDFAIRSVGSAFDGTIRVTALLILLYYISESVVSRLNIYVPI